MERGLGGCCWKSATLGIPVAVQDAPGGEGRKGGVKRGLGGLCAKSASPGIPVVLRCAAGLRSFVGGLPAVPGKTGVAGGDAAAGVGRGTLKELICSLPDEEQETVVSVLGRLVGERGEKHRCVRAVLRELAGSDSEMCVGFCVHAVVVGASYVHGEGVGSVGWDDGSLYGAMGAVMECV